MLVTFNPGLNFPYQCFFDNEKCLLVNQDCSDYVLIRSTLYNEDRPFIIEEIPAALIHLAWDMNLLTVH